MKHAGTVSTVWSMLAAVCMVTGCLGCFLNDDTFAFNRVWKQKTTVNTYRIMTITTDVIKIECFQGQTLTKSERMFCLHSHMQNKYFVRTDDEDGDSKHMYGCIAFELLTPTTMRYSETIFDDIRKKINCAQTGYTEEKYVWFANLRYFGVECPLNGGYQLIIASENVAVSPTCLASIQAYNPRIQFECDNVNSGNVLVEMGDACDIRALWGKLGSMKRNLLHFRCVSHWTKGTTTSLLMQMQEDEDQVWCLQYRRILPDDGFMPMYLSVYGYCLGDSFDPGQGIITDQMHIVYGALALYSAASDRNCIDYYNESQCPSPKTCLISNKCPSLCNRCPVEETFPLCRFDARFRGYWKPLSATLHYIAVSVHINTINGFYGSLTCIGKPVINARGIVLYTAEQTGSVPTCKPVHVCLNLKYLAPGMILFELHPAFRRTQDGSPFSCSDVQNMISHHRLISHEKPLTLYNRRKLMARHCNFSDNSFFRTSERQCRLIVYRCDSLCKSLRLDLDSVTCDNETMSSYRIFTNHTCLQRLHFKDLVWAILARNDLTRGILCWIFAGSDLLIATPEECNEVSAFDIIHRPEAIKIYSPLVKLSASVDFISGSCCGLACRCLVCGGILVYLSLRKFFSL